jgi:signal transduction histidine kinase
MISLMALFTSQAGLLLLGMLSGLLCSALVGYLAYLSIQSMADRKIAVSFRQMEEIRATVALLQEDLASTKTPPIRAPGTSLSVETGTTLVNRELVLRLQQQGRTTQEISHELQIPAREISLMLKVQQLTVRRKDAVPKISSTSGENLRKCS